MPEVMRVELVRAVNIPAPAAAVPLVREVLVAMAALVVQGVPHTAAVVEAAAETLEELEGMELMAAPLREAMAVLRETARMAG
jgi:hypothetical protein